MFSWADLPAPVTRKVGNKAKAPDRLRDEPLGDAAPASHGDAAAAAPTALPVRPPGVPVVSIGPLRTENPQVESAARNHVPRSLPGSAGILPRELEPAAAAVPARTALPPSLPGKKEKKKVKRSQSL